MVRQHQRREVPFSLLEERDDAARDENVLRATADAINGADSEQERLLEEGRAGRARADLDRAQQAEEADLAPLRAEHARHAARLRHRLEELATKADAKELAADTKRRAAAQAVTDEKETAEKARIPWPARGRADHDALPTPDASRSGRRQTWTVVG